MFSVPSYKLACIFVIVAYMHTLSVTQVQVAGFDKNFSYLIIDGVSTQALVVDPCGDIERVFSEIEVRELTIAGILLTHTHLDHHERLSDALARYDAPVYLHTNGTGRTSAGADTEVLLRHGSTVPLGDASIQTFHTPGHLDDCITYYIKKEDATDNTPKLITGDTLFVEGCGRTTSAGVEKLYESIQFLKSFPNETEIYPGHDYGSRPVSTIEHEKEYNKYFLAQSYEEFRSIRLPEG